MPHCRLGRFWKQSQINAHILNYTHPEILTSDSACSERWPRIHHRRQPSNWAQSADTTFANQQVHIVARDIRYKGLPGRAHAFRFPWCDQPCTWFQMFEGCNTNPSLRTRIIRTSGIPEAPPCPRCWRRARPSSSHCMSALEIGDPLIGFKWIKGIHPLTSFWQVRANATRICYSNGRVTPIAGRSFINPLKQGAIVEFFSTNTT